MITIYCIEDINDLKYVGSTKQNIEVRLTRHRYAKLTNKNCSSKNLNLENCIIYSLETCDETKRLERERYWINQMDCVNQIKLICDKKIDQRTYYEKNKEKIRKRKLEYYHKNKDKINQKRKSKRG